MRHALSEVDPEARRAVCAVCGPVRIKSGGYTFKGSSTRVWKCKTVATPGPGRSGRQRWKYRGRVGAECERCGFVPEHVCQLDVHHRDGDHRNSDDENLETLCANCHRLVSHFERLNALTETSAV